MDKLIEYMETIRPRRKDQTVLLFELEQIAERLAKQLVAEKEREKAEILIKIGMYEGVNKVFE